jgi:hypothetical protein
MAYLFLLSRQLDFVFGRMWEFDAASLVPIADFSIRQTPLVHPVTSVISATLLTFMVRYLERLFIFAGSRADKQQGLSWDCCWPLILHWSDFPLG